MADTIRVLTYNLLNQSEGPAAFGRRFDTLADLILECAPDVLCLQEVPDTERVRALAGMLVERQQRAMFMALTKLERPDGWSEYLAIIHPGTRATATRHVAATGERIGISLTLAASGITVMCAHLNPQTADGRHAQAQVLAGALAGAAPALLCGDLDAAPDGGTLGLLRERFTVLGPDVPGPPTFATGLRTEPATPVILDYVLGRGLTATDTGLIGAEQVNGVWASDHVGVWVDVAIG